LVSNELAVMIGTWGTGSFRVVATELGSFSLYLRALWAVITRRPLRFRVTPKTASASRQGRAWPLVAPHMAIIVATLGALGHAIVSYSAEADSAFSARAILLNGFWGAYNVLALSGMVLAGFRGPPSGEGSVKSPIRVAARHHILFIVALVAAALISLSVEPGSVPARRNDVESTSSDTHRAGSGRRVADVLVHTEAICLGTV
jgi:hypothetical protein